jgi:hypothetical protein
VRHLRAEHPAGGSALGLIVMPGAAAFRDTREVNFGAWAAVKCKGGKCRFTGLGLRESGRAHLAAAHPGEGVENLNIFCRVCEQNIDQSVRNFDDEEELEEHIIEKHADLLTLMKAGAK